MADKKKPDQTVIPPDEADALLFAAHLLGEDETGLSDPPTKLPKASRAGVTVLNPFHIRGVSGPIIEGEAKPPKEGK